jgi:hypothetical protein
VEPIIISYPRRNAALAIIYPLCLIGLGIILLIQDRNDLVIWLCVIFFVLLIFRNLLRLRNYPLPVQIDNNGIFMGRRFGLIPWSDIRGAHVHWLFKSFVCIRLRKSSEIVDSFSTFDRLVSPFVKLLGFSEIGLNLTGIRIEPNDITNVINGHCTRGD